MHTSVFNLFLQKANLDYQENLDLVSDSDLYDTEYESFFIGHSSHYFTRIQVFQDSQGHQDHVENKVLRVHKDHRDLKD